MSLPRLTISIMNLQARQPVTNEARKPAERGPAATPAVRSPLTASSSVSPRIGASTIRNENCATAAFLLPSKRPVAIVVPERERPGMAAQADAHLKRTIMGRETVVAITEGRLDFGTWEQIFYFEFDGKRDKRVLIKIIGE